MKQFILISFILILFTNISNAGELSWGLENYMADHPEETTTKVMVRLTQQADIDFLDNHLREINATRQYRHEVVVTQLKEVAQGSQSELLQFLESKKNEGKVIDYRPFWITNAIAVEGTRDVISQIAGRNDVDFVYVDFKVSLIEPVEIKPDPGSRSLEPGVEVINAPQVWAMGYTGQGVLVCDQDTGADGNHPAFASRWRGLEAPWEECWLDVLGGNTQFPYDNGGHGTHTLGTILGAAPGDTVGVAPDAKWIASNSVDQGTGGGFDSDVVETFQWAADPDGNPETIEDVPDVVNNSWRVNEWFGGYVDCDPRYNESIVNCEAASVIVIFAAGNEGPNTSTIGSPPDQLLSPTQVFSVGAVDGNYGPPYQITNFSSRGPSTCEGSPDLQIKPEVSAPGNNVRSSMPGGGYGTMSGTSMACPHVVGTVALMRSINPDLDVQRAKEILMESAVDQGEPGEDNTYGWGVIDAYQAALLTFETMSAFEGYVTHSETGNPLPAQVYIPETPGRASADEETGFYHMGVAPDTLNGYQVHAQLFGYYDYISDTYYLSARDTVELNIEMLPLPSGFLVGHVTDTDGNPLPNTQLSSPGLPVPSIETDGQGYYQYNLPGDFTYIITAYASDHDSTSFQVYVGADSTTTFDIQLSYVQSFESTDGGYTLSGNISNEWEWGIPQESGGPSHAYMGTNVWGTDLDNTYQQNGYWQLNSPRYSLSESDSIVLKFFTWYDLEEGWDGGNVKCRSNVDTSWSVLQPVGNYPDNSVIGLSGQPGFTGTSQGWEPYKFYLNDYLGSDYIQLRFHFGSTNSQEKGWFIDNLTIYGVNMNPYLAPHSLQSTMEDNGNYANTYLSWQSPNANDITGFNIYRRVEGDTYADEAIGTTSSEITEYTDVLNEYDTYYYMITATYGDTESPHSNETMVQWTTGINGGLATDIPKHYELFPNHPNPFNPTTLIRFALPQKVKVSLKIYDTAGKLVRNLVEGSKESGYHSIVWNGKNEAGQDVPSGVYFYKIETDSYNKTKSMLLLK